MGGTKVRGREPADDGQVWARIVNHRASYFITRHESGEDSFIDDEAELEIVATIDAITTSQRKHVGGDLTVSLLAAKRYAPAEASPTLFFGSVNLRGSQRSALAYLPSTPFWALPQMIRGRDARICIGWEKMKRGYAQLSSVLIGDEQDRKRLLELGGNALAT